MTFLLVWSKNNIIAAYCYYAAVIVAYCKYAAMAFILDQIRCDMHWPFTQGRMHPKLDHGKQVPFYMSRGCSSMQTGFTEVCS